jgi:diguanylate cyclase (GGDEF)-like protein
MAARYTYSTDPSELFTGYALPLVADGFAFCAVLGSVALFLPHPPEVRDAAGWILVVVSLVASILMRLLRTRLSPRLLNWLPAPAIAILLAAVWVGGDSWVAVALAGFLSLVAAGLLPYQPVKWTVPYLAVMGVGCGVVLAASGFDGWLAATVVLFGELTGVTFIAGTLVSRLRTLAMCDELTQIDNRRAFHRRVGEEMQRSRRSTHTFSVALIDLDGFKQVNDTHGHHAGDELLVRISKAWVAVLRPEDCLARWGGDEFALMLPGCEEDGTEVVIERLREAMPEAHSFSGGIATWDRVEGTDDLVRRADAALYARKAAAASSASPDDTWVSPAPARVEPIEPAGTRAPVR